jgi:redox-sensitive bicupin YhaK (pirin superfamily)
MTDAYAERGFYVAAGSVELAGTVYAAGNLVVLNAGAAATLRATAASTVMLLGGEKLPGERTIWWNFVSSDKARLERAKADWKAGKFPKVPGEDEFIPLPD